jgi:hypothetical protein
MTALLAPDLLDRDRRKLEAAITLKIRRPTAAARTGHSHGDVTGRRGLK